MPALGEHVIGHRVHKGVPRVILRAALLVVQVAAVLGRVGDDRVHLVQLHARDRVRDERRLVQRLVVRALGLHAHGDHLLEGDVVARALG